MRAGRGRASERDEHEVWKSFEYTSLFDYCTGRLELTRGSACAYIAVVRKGKEVPQLIEAVTDGSLNVHDAKRITKVIEPENANDWINAAKNSPQRDLEKAVALAQPEPAACGRLRRVGGEMSNLNLVIPAKRNAGKAARAGSYSH